MMVLLEQLWVLAAKPISLLKIKRISIFAKSISDVAMANKAESKEA
jgi:hypothetical protein